jgi:hypothetical protein
MCHSRYSIIYATFVQVLLEQEWADYEASTAQYEEAQRQEVCTLHTLQL